MLDKSAAIAPHLGRVAWDRQLPCLGANRAPGAGHQPVRLALQRHLCPESQRGPLWHSGQRPAQPVLLGMGEGQRIGFSRAKRQGERDPPIQPRNAQAEAPRPCRAAQRDLDGRHARLGGGENGHDRPHSGGGQNSHVTVRRNAHGGVAQHGQEKPLTATPPCGMRQHSRAEPPDSGPSGAMSKGITMPNEEWGTKRLCPTTGKRFYDLNRSPIVSPYTGEVVDIESARRKLAAAVISRAVPDKDDDVLVDDLDTDEDLLAAGVTDDADLDDDLLEDDADDNVSLDDLADVAGDEEEV